MSVPPHSLELARLSPVERITRAIRVVRGRKVLLDVDLAVAYSVAVKALNQAVKRNAARFPADFVFRLGTREAASLRSQIVTLETAGRGQHRKYLPYAFHRARGPHGGERPQ